VLVVIAAGAGHRPAASPAPSASDFAQTRSLLVKRTRIFGGAAEAPDQQARPCRL